MPDTSFKDELLMQADRFAAEYLRGILTSVLGVEADARLLQERHPHLERQQLSERLAGDAVMRSGQIGVATGIPTLLPLLGGAFLAGSIAADTTFLLREQLGMLIQLLYLHAPDQPRAERELEALELYARFASPDEVPTSPTPALAGHVARTTFKHVGRRILRHVWRKRISAWFSIPLSLILSAKVNRDATAELGAFAIIELRRR